ncbi:Calcium uptake protein 3, mitochondrial [Desmophyllum pertusum]|uniref:Calcium uptake protein 3, mitochondrial n=2 Tax=Desmophyllum pertusum TaxID=174260 RepID=A0A9W9Y8X8_9CNID|nr:Calcium uptake protein 3, mitochondrial [Desmophyllum pertusum]
MFSSFARKTSFLRVTLVGIGGVGCCLLWRSQNRNSTVNVVVAKSADHVHAQTRRKTKFDQFASIEVDGQYLMTPADFLESVMHKDLPGVITFSEYLFLLTILTKSQRGLEIAFKMLDKDGNGRLCKNEFFVLAEMVNKKSSAKSMALHENGEKENGDCLNKTTLTMHFFGSRGTGQLTSSQFSKELLSHLLKLKPQEGKLTLFILKAISFEFLDSVHFMEYSRGMPTIPEDSFARLLLRNTSLEEEEIQQYLDRLFSRLNQRKGITLEQFLSFGMFLNNLEDFALAMRIYSIAGQAVTQGNATSILSCLYPALCGFLK